MTPHLVPFREVRRITGIDSTNALKAACSRYGIPVIRFNARVLALKNEDVQLLLARVLTAEAA